MSRFLFIILLAAILVTNYQLETSMANGMPYRQNPGDISGNIVPVKEERVKIVND